MTSRRKYILLVIVYVSISVTLLLDENRALPNNDHCTIPVVDATIKNLK